MSLIKDHLIKAIRGAAIHYSDVQVPPTCILWPDGDPISSFYKKN